FPSTTSTPVGSTETTALRGSPTRPPCASRTPRAEPRYRRRVAGVSSVAEAISRMEAIVAPLPRADGVACFTRLYLAVTQGVEAELAGVALRDPRFLERLDIAFAQLYFDA